MNQGPTKNGRRADLTKETASTRSFSKQKDRYKEQRPHTDTNDFLNYKLDKKPSFSA